MTVKDLKKLIADLPEDLDDKEIWYVEFGGYDKTIRAAPDDKYGVAIIGD